jgi:polyhydroxybutyrate depolymerase
MKTIKLHPRRATDRLAKAGGVAALGCLLAIALTPTTASATCGANTLSPGEQTINISFGGSNRSYILHTPTGYTGTTAVPLVIDIHGFTSSASGQRGVSGYQAKADRAGFIVAWPQGLNNSWNGYGCCGNSLNGNVNDVGFIKAVANDIIQRGVVDEGRIYITGLSNGGSMSHRLACEGAEKFAATSPVSFTLNRTSCPAGFPARPITVAHYHGLNDTTVNYNGGQFQSAPASFSSWQTIDACNGTVARQNLSSTESVQTATTCSAGVTPALVSLAGTHVLYNTQTTLVIADHAWDTYLSKFTLPNAPTNACQGGGTPPPPPPPPPPPGTCTAGNTGFLSPSAQAADAGGDGNGFQTNPTNAFASGGGEASNTNGAADRHRWFNYNISIPSGCTVKGIEVQMVWRLDSTAGTSSQSVDLSADAGASFTAQKTDSQETTQLHTVVLGSATDTWGRSWSATDLSNGNFRVRTTSNSSSAFRDFFLDWIPVRVSYGP